MKSLLKKYIVSNFVITCFLSVNIFPTDLCGPTSGTLTLAESPYIVTCNVLVPDGQILIIEPGVVIKFDLGKILEVAGTLIAEGTAGNLITFTSNVSVPGAGDWGEIYFMQSENSILHYCTIEYAGAGATPITALNLFFSDVSIQNTKITNNLGSGINISFSAPSITNNCIILGNTAIGIDCDFAAVPVISNCQISFNGDYAISMYANNINKIGSVNIFQNTKNSIRVFGASVGDGTWTNHGVPYVIDGFITVNDGQTLTIDPGTELLFNGNYFFKVNGSLVAIGEPEYPIFFGSNRLVPKPGDWRGLDFDNSELSTLLYCEIAYGGSNTAAIKMLNSNPFFNVVWVYYSATNGINLSNSSPEIINGLFSLNAGIGIVVSFDSDPILNSCIIEDNGDYAISMYAGNIKNIIGDMSIVGNAKNSIRVEGESVNTGVWKDHIVPYVINGTILVANGETLTLNPGVELRFNGDYNFDIRGALIADGTEQFPIVFTSNKINPNPGDWGGLTFFGSDPGTKLDNCLILFGGGNVNFGALDLTNSSFSITNTVVKKSAASGIHLFQSFTTIRGCTISDNLGDGVHITIGQPDLGTVKDPGNNKFLNNAEWEVYNNTSDTIYAQRNEWGTLDSATIDANHIYDDDENPSKGIVIFMPTGKITDVEEDIESEILIEFILEQNYPNPFNPSTVISYQLAVRSQVTLKIYDVLGNEVATLVNEGKPPGSYEVEFDGSKLSSGIYFYRLQAGNFVETKKMVFLR